MSTVLRFKRFLCPEVVPGDGVYLFSELGGQARLHGPLAERLAPLLDGKYSREEVIEALSDDFALERVHRALDQLIDGGQVIYADPAADHRAGGFWELYGLHGDTAMAVAAGRCIELTCFGDVPADDFAAAVASGGLRMGTGNPDLTVVLADDYLHPALAGYNQRQLSAGRPWLLAKPVGAQIWVGPVFQPGHTGCWACLATRLAGNQLVMNYVCGRTGRTSFPATSVADLPVTRRIAAELTVLHAVKWLAGALGAHLPQETPGGEPSYAWQPPAPGEVLTFDTAGLTARRHILQRRPQCRECGDPGLQASLHHRPVMLVSRPKATVTDGGHRAKSADQLVAEQEPLISPITGVVKQLVRSPGNPAGLYAYNAGQNFAVPMRGIGDLRAGLRSSAAGKGMSEVQAKASAIAEAIERYSGLYRGDEARVASSLTKLGGDGIAPNELACYSERQIAERDWWNAKGTHFQRVCGPFDPDAVIDWTPVWSLTHHRVRYLPTASLFFGYPMEPGNIYAGADSNGNAAGTSLEDAIVQGFMELVERDTVGMWWYHMLRRPAVDLSSFAEPYFARWQERYRSVHRDTWVLDVTNDLGIPSVVAVSRRTDKPAEDILIAFGAHFDVKVAIGRALTEMNQFLPAVVNVTAESGDYAFPDPDQQRWWRTATIANQPYLLPSGEPPRTAADFTDMSTTDLAEDVRTAQRVVETAGMEMLVLDQTRPDIGLPVVKVIVPGMRVFWTRFAPGRLYDVPVAMGWLKEPTPESDLNPIGMFL
ncbi:MAG TPA: TOMM precursor leader peptide-binding protein [Streptosporangiaceae bacterium]|nr:TOMM precursor leader peptide-binding protein [Streptosporangiaceae bacterium]